jgi:serine/threonine protein kinase
LAGGDSAQGSGTPDDTISLFRPAAPFDQTTLVPGLSPAPVAPPAAPGLHPLAERTGQYHLFGEIGRGGMGTILQAIDPELGREVVLKVLQERHRDRPELVRRFLEEAQICGQLQHPGIVPVHDVGTLADGRPFFAMKRVKGRTLAALLAARPDPSHDQPRFLGIFEQVGQTLAYAHSRGVIHRDLKPANVMVGSFGEVQVMDWGLAKVLFRGGPSSGPADPDDDSVTVVTTIRGASDADASLAGTVLGTPAYMPPEQARGEIARVDERADVFALGAILCEILTGLPPYAGARGNGLKHVAANAELGNGLNRLDASGADPELVALAKACLKPTIEARPRDSHAVADALTAYLVGVRQRLQAAELARAEAQARAAEERKRRKLTMGLAALLLLCVVLGGRAYLLAKRSAADSGCREIYRGTQHALQNARVLPYKAAWTLARDQAKTLTAWVVHNPVSHDLTNDAVQFAVYVECEEAAAEGRAALAELLRAALQGSDHLDDAPKGLDFARMAYKARHYDAGAARLYSTSHHHYDAACAAALAGTRQGDEVPSDEKDRTTLRRQALDWLHAEQTA